MDEGKGTMIGVQGFLLLALLATLASCASYLGSFGSGQLRDCPPVPQPSTPGGPDACATDVGSQCFGFATPSGAKWHLGPYAQMVQSIVQSHWHLPEGELTRFRGWTEVCFAIDQSGDITDLRINHFSGCPAYDHAAVEALRNSCPLPPLPAEVTVNQIRSRFRFYYNMPNQDCGRIH